MTENVAQAEALLKHLGLTEYESKAYLTLLIHGSLTAEKVSRFGSIPLPRVYDTMGSLIKRGLVFSSKTRPQTFRITDPNKILEIIKEDEKRKNEEKIKEIEKIIPEFLKEISSLKSKPEEETEETIMYVKRKVNMKKIWTDLHKEAKEEILVFGGDLSWIVDVSTLLKNLLKKHIRYEILWCKKFPEALKNVKRFKKAGADLRYNDSFGSLRGFIIDGKKVSLAQTFRRGEEPQIDIQRTESTTDFTTILITNKLIVDVFRQYFLSLWKQSKKIDKFQKK